MTAKQKRAQARVNRDAPVLVRFQPEERARVAEAAKKEGLSISAFVRTTVIKYIASKS